MFIPDVEDLRSCVEEEEDGVGLILLFSTGCTVEGRERLEMVGKSEEAVVRHGLVRVDGESVVEGAYGESARREAFGIEEKDLVLDVDGTRGSSNCFFELRRERLSEDGQPSNGRVERPRVPGRYQRTHKGRTEGLGKCLILISVASRCRNP